MSEPARWEYQFVRVAPGIADAGVALTRLGAEGWRVVQISALPNDAGAVYVLLERAVR